MKIKLLNKFFLYSFIGSFFLVDPLSAQLSETFSKVFTDILARQLQLSGSPGEHGTHFLEAADLANSELGPALNSLIASNVSSFPLSSTSAGVTFDFSTGKPVSITESLGPIFAETAETLGKGKVNVGFNFSYLSLSKFRGLDTEEMRFTFTHQDVTNDGTLGESTNESDTIDLFPDINVDATILSLFATLGVTNNLDIGVAIPLINVGLSGTARAKVNSFTFAALDSANHHFGQDSFNPEFETTFGYDESGTGLGDIAIRFKYSFIRGTALDLAALLDVRIPTGAKDDFLGAGKTNVRLSGILSKKIGDFTPHLNLGYDRRAADLDSDEFEFVAGFDQKIASGLSFAFDILGELDLDDDEVIKLFPGTRQIVDQVPNGQSVRDVDLSNIPEKDNDNSISASFGFRYAPSKQVIFLGNILVPLNDGGLRSKVAATYGITVSL